MSDDQQPECCECGCECDPRMKCSACKEPLCERCAVHDEDGRGFCLTCYADVEQSEQPLGPWW